MEVILLIQLDFSDKRPIYEQIKDRIKKLILTGALKPGEKVYSVREMAQMLSINPNTIQKAFRELETEGYIHTVQGKGSFVVSDALDKAKLIENELSQKLFKLIQEFLYWQIPIEVPFSIINNVYSNDAHKVSEEVFK